MYYENVNRTINVWRDGDVLHVFITAPNQKKYNQFSQTIDYVKGILGMNFTYEYDGTQIYFPLGDFRELNEFKQYFYRYLCCFPKEKN
jgi:hypothetical protein